MGCAQRRAGRGARGLGCRLSCWLSPPWLPVEPHAAAALGKRAAAAAAPPSGRPGSRRRVPPARLTAPARRWFSRGPRSAPAGCPLPDGSPAAPGTEFWTLGGHCWVDVWRVGSSECSMLSGGAQIPLSHCWPTCTPSREHGAREVGGLWVPGSRKEGQAHLARDVALKHVLAPAGLLRGVEKKQGHSLAPFTCQASRHRPSSNATPLEHCCGLALCTPGRPSLLPPPPAPAQRAAAPPSPRSPRS